MIKRLFIIYIYGVILLSGAGCILLIGIIGQQIFKKLTLGIGCIDCVVDLGVLKVSNEGFRYIDFTYNNEDFIARTVYTSGENQEEDGTMVTFYYKKTEPSFNRIDTSLESKAVYTSLYTLIALLVIEGLCIYTIKRSK